MTVFLKRVRLELARTPEYPEGNREHGYEFVAPVNGVGQIDSDAWKNVKDLCRVTRFSEQGTETGFLRHAGHGWRFDYNGRRDQDDEPLFKLDRHALLPGNYISVTEHDGVQRPFKVITVVPA